MATGRITAVTPLVPGAAGRISWGKVDLSIDGVGAQSWAYRPRAGAQSTRVELAFAPLAREFEVCPICLDGDADTVEHIPNRALGGSAMTKTCAQCNNRLGSALEPHLQTWVSESLTGTRFAAHGIRGQRPLPRIELRWADDGRFGLMIAGSVQPEVNAALHRGGEFSLSFPAPDMARVRLAALKHAYLVTCLALGEIARGPTADVVRGVLRYVRELRAREPVPDNIAAWAEATVQLGRTYRPPTTAPVSIMARQPVPDTGAVDAWICLAGVVMVRWPLPEFALVTAA